jgi:RND family efflux transporter MFP subunit
MHCRANLHFLLAFLPVMAVAPQAGAGQASDGVLVRVGQVLREQVRERRTVIGSLEPSRRSAVAAEEAGRVVQAPPEPGLPVKAGQVLARTDDTILAAQRTAAEAVVREAQARVHEFQAQLGISQRNLQELENRLQWSAAGGKEIADARSTVDADQARLAVAEAQLNGAGAQLQIIAQRLEKTSIRAPFDGFTVAKSTELGQWVEAGQTVSQMVEIARVKARLHVPQQLLPHVHGDEPIDLHVDALNSGCSAPLFSIIPEADPQARTFQILVKLDNPDGRLKPGMSVSAALPTGRVESVLTVPRDAVQSTPAGMVAYAHRAGVAVMVPLTIRFGHGDRFVVTGDLREGEQVVIEGNERLRPGQPLKIIEPQGTAR